MSNGIGVKHEYHGTICKFGESLAGIATKNPINFIKFDIRKKF